MKQLHDVEYPNDFRMTEGPVAGDKVINDLIKSLSLKRCIKGKGGRYDFISAADTFVILTELGFVEVYKLVGECEVEVPW